MSILDKKIIGCIGLGNMGSAIIAPLASIIKKENLLRTINLENVETVLVS